MDRRIRLIERGATPSQLREVPITQMEFLIGRGADCDLHLHASAVSRHHCIIRLSSGEALLVDLGSSNGTYLNGQRVRSQANLRTGDEIRIGSCTFVLDLGDGGELNLGDMPTTDSTAVTQQLEDLPNGDPPASDP